MIDIGAVLKSLNPCQARDRIEEIQTMGRSLANRIAAVFVLIGHRACQFEGSGGETYHALVHNHPDDPTDYLVVNLAGEGGGQCFESMKTDIGWITNYVDRDHYGIILKAVNADLLSHINQTYSRFVQNNFGYEPEPVSEQDVNLDILAEDLAGRTLVHSHEGNKRLAF